MIEDQYYRMLLEKIPDLNTVYEDVAQPALKKVGVALGTIIDLGMFPLTLLDIKRNDFLNKFSKKLDNIDDERIIPVPPEISVPVVQFLSYYTNNDLRELFLNLLSKCANTETVSSAHPSYIKIIQSISADEAIILRYINERKETRYPIIFHKMNYKFKEGYEIISRHTCDIDFIDLNLTFPENMLLYFENLSSLGLMTFDYVHHLTNVTESYESLNQRFHDIYKEYIERKFKENLHRSISYEKGIMEVTHLGIGFCETCIGGKFEIQK